MFKFLLDAGLNIFMFLKGYWKHAYKSRLIMYLFIIVPGALFVIVALSLCLYLASEYNSALGSFSKRQEFLYKENEYRYALDNITVCTESAEKKLSDEEFFCKKAMELYRKSVADNDHRGVAIGYDHKAYSLAKIDLSLRLRLSEINRYAIDRPSSKVMNIIFFKFNIVFIILGAGYSMMIITSMLFYIYRKKSNGEADHV